VIRLTSSAEGKGPPSWSGDGKRLTYAVNRGDTTALFELPSGGGPAKVVTVLEGKALALSHDGRHLVFTKGTWTRNRAWVARADGSEAHAITDSVAGYFNFAWSPDDNLLATTRRDSTGDLQVWVMGAEGENAHPLTHFPSSDGRPQWPAWSPDGRRIALQSGIYSREKPETSTAHVWIVDVATGSATKLAPHDKPWLDETPSWFSDGRHLAFQSDRSGAMELWVMNADGTEPRQITK